MKRLPMIIRSLVAALVLAAGCVASAGAVPLRLQSDDDPVYGDDEGLHLFLPSAFLEGVHRDRLQFARIRYFRERFREENARGAYDKALAVIDSLIDAAEDHRIPGVPFIESYIKRAATLRRLGRDREAASAYAYAVRVQDSLLRSEQEQTIRLMNERYEADRLTLERTLLRALRHKQALIWTGALLLAALGVVIPVFLAVRHTRRLQRELLDRIEQSHESERQKASFINSICHEVRTPLNSMTGFSELLLSEGLTPQNYIQYCEIVQESRRQLRDLFDDMIEVAALENLQTELPHGYVDLCALCRRQLRIMRMKYLQKADVAYTSTIPAAEIGMNTSEKYVAILIDALLDNAYKFTCAGTIDLRCERLDVDCVRIAVTDTGCGIPPEKYACVFRRFTKLDAFSQGNGLGLYLCRLIVERLGGRIGIDPSYTGGTRVEVVLPRK